MIRSLVGLATYYHELSPVKVAVFRDLGKLTVGSSTELLSRGVEASIPFWLAELLSKDGSVEIKENMLEPREVAMALISERGSDEKDFAKLKSRFYLEIRKLIRKTREASTKEPEAAVSLLKLESNLDDLIQYRLRKITKIAVLSTEGEIDEYLDKVLIEEGTLLKILKSIISGWRLFVSEQK
ncbi:MAG: hypothetical protein QN229_01635 [Desulfurococcaceae archaeon TW002]